MVLFFKQIRIHCNNIQTILIDCIARPLFSNARIFSTFDSWQTGFINSHDCRICGWLGWLGRKHHLSCAGFDQEAI